MVVQNIKNGVPVERYAKRHMTAVGTVFPFNTYRKKPNFATSWVLKTVSYS